MVRPRRLRSRAFWAGLLAALATALPAAAQQLALEGARVYVGNGQLIESGAVWIADGRIRAVGSSAELQIPADVPRLRAAVIVPGLIDAHTSAGIAGLYNVDADRDQDEGSDPDTADLRALDAFHPREPLLRYLLEHGVTVVQTSPGPRNVIGGQAAILRTHGKGQAAAVLSESSAMVFNLGEQPKAEYGSRSARPSAPETRMAVAALIRRRLAEARSYARSRGGLLGSGVPYDARLEALARVVSGELPAIFRAERADDILTALRLAREFELRPLLAGVTEGYLVAQELAAAGAQVSVGPVMVRPNLPELENANFENAALLARAGVPISIRSGFEASVPKSRVVLFEAAIAAANGLGFAGALRAISLGAAEQLGIARDYGSLSAGKIADAVLFDGDPFEYTTHVEAVVAGGEVVHRR
jgi:imidazolonepropionase-like amidohydrolase